ncbi:MAG: hypothetical protein IPL53_16405 [Ignavibacteria bacterium]|nr:hypothetical protein [Ignavibacteria bacterium]
MNTSTTPMELLYYINKTSSADSFIDLRVSSDGLISGFMIVIINKLRQVFFVICAENANVFDSVVKRYCEVPP